MPILSLCHIWCVTVVWALSLSRLALAKRGWRGCPDRFKEAPGAALKLGSWPTSNLGDKANSWSESNQLLTISHNPPAHHSQIKWWEHSWYQDSWDWSWQSQSPRASPLPGRIKQQKIQKKTIRQTKCNLEKSRKARITIALALRCNPSLAISWPTHSFFCFILCFWSQDTVIEIL